MGIFSKIFGSSPNNGSPPDNKRIQQTNNNIKVTGTRSYGDGTKYVGEFINGVENGQGRINFSDGAYYAGEWKDGQYHGKGRYHRREYTYEGEWKNGKYHGQGKKSWFNADDYIGSWEEDKRVIRQTFLCRRKHL